MREEEELAGAWRKEVRMADSMIRVLVVLCAAWAVHGACEADCELAAPAYSRAGWSESVGVVLAVSESGSADEGCEFAAPVQHLAYDVGQGEYSVTSKHGESATHTPQGPYTPLSHKSVSNEQSISLLLRLGDDTIAQRSVNYDEELSSRAEIGPNWISSSRARAYFLVPPTTDEGFAELYSISTLEGGMWERFVVTDEEIMLRVGSQHVDGVYGDRSVVRMNAQQSNDECIEQLYFFFDDTSIRFAAAKKPVSQVPFVLVSEAPYDLVVINAEPQDGKMTFTIVTLDEDNEVERNAVATPVSEVMKLADPSWSADGGSFDWWTVLWAVSSFVGAIAVFVAIIAGAWAIKKRKREQQQQMVEFHL